ncbi:beta-glucosidase 24-like [Pyrus ussuriensis x Pyrus communis]|uniref:Beta-glucosidase 24-like n=1 Tax=Pyrus ussuriensis x Pyrus communis TaxID=2448454 RepID=A0A5N5IA51_9ROSA|nr:beta-glucosidase 24-like [Pyrus ussuriensis x Pyrus communis]
MTVDVDPFLLATVGMVDAHLPKNKGKRKVEFVPIQLVPKQNSQPRLKLDLFSNEPPTELSRPVIIKSMSDSSAKETERPMVLCSHCKTRVVLNGPKEKAAQVPTTRQLSTSLEYMREFHKKHSANDLYDLPKTCQEALDLALTYPDAEQIIQKTTNLTMKARFQRIQEARILGFEHVPEEVKDDQVVNTPKHDTALENPKDDDQDPISSSEDGQADKDDKLKVALAVLFPRSSSVNL